MQGRGNSHGWLVHLIAGVALGAAGVLVAWIVAGGQPFGDVIGGDDVSAPTSVIAPETAAERRVARLAADGSRLTARPPALSSPPRLEFMKPKRETKTSKPSRTRRKAKTRRPARKTRSPVPVVQVVSPPPTDAVAVAPAAPAAPPPVPAAPAPSGQRKPSAPGGGGKPAAPPDDTSYVGEG